MSRGQASTEYLLLCIAVLVSACLLVRFHTPVIAIARGVQHAVSAPPQRRAPHRHGGRHGPAHRNPPSCWCAPAAAPD